jgi:phage tail-like protein
MAARTSLVRWGTHATDPLRNFKFYVEFVASSNSGTPFDDRIKTFSGGFSQVQGLNINTQSIAYREGGYNTTVHQIPGMTTFTPIVLSRGMVYGQDQAITWMRGLFAAAAGQGLSTAGKDFRLDMKIYVNDHPVTNTSNADAGIAVPQVQFHIHNAWLSNLSFTDLNATDNNILFEQMTFVHEGLSVFFTDTSTGEAKPTLT